MKSKSLAIIFAALGAAALLSACESDDVHAASADRPLNRACRPGPTPEGTRSGLACDPGSSTGSPSGSDANIQGAASTGSARAD